MSGSVWDGAADVRCPGRMRLEPWKPDTAMRSHFFRRGTLLPEELIPDFRPHLFVADGMEYVYVCGIDAQGPCVSVSLNNVPLPFPVGVSYRPEPAQGYEIRCAECVARFHDEQVDKELRELDAELRRRGLDPENLPDFTAQTASTTTAEKQKEQGEQCGAKLQHP